MADLPWEAGTRLADLANRAGWSGRDALVGSNGLRDSGPIIRDGDLARLTLDGVSGTVEPMQTILVVLVGAQTEVR